MWIAYVVTSQDRLEDGSFNKLIKSLESQSCPVRIIVGLRGCALPPEYAGKIHSSITLPFRISLSSARNRLLAHEPSNLGDWICFPDDDCWYPKDLLLKVNSELKNFDFLVGVIDTGQKKIHKFFKSEPYVKIGLQEALKHTASAALFLDAEAMRGFVFDERLGLGAQVGSAEDLDLTLYLLSKGSRGLFSKDILVKHPFKPNRERDYFEGSIAALSKYYRSIRFARFSAFRRTIKGILLFASGKLSSSQLKRTFFYLLNRW